jgi:hypothetical protein
LALAAAAAKEAPGSCFGVSLPTPRKAVDNVFVCYTSFDTLSEDTGTEQKGRVFEGGHVERGKLPSPQTHQAVSQTNQAVSCLMFRRFV